MVRVCDRRREVGGQTGALGDRLGLARDPTREAAAAEVLERQERPSPVLAHLVDLDDPGVTELRQGLSFPREPGRGPGVQHPPVLE